ncbi:DUF4159 domain-containing protein [Rhizobiaceae bacterium BDR2-2]|uniref:DUF4159 domain-containing protein n=1 Tax=Ectorhizobium quercum TaxID=2965071 RepID=A0AAE3MYF8_9HYPH|nr:DUF4159 domain-containing protein [Ectorhizobium quercum]MCX8996601.1 DUF4159 domain-containing protein [Ectorhizobium quercum]
MSALSFATPAVLAALLALPLIWWLLRLTPPRPQQEVFPPLKILERILKREETPAKSPWWLTALRMALAAAVILALAGPVLNRDTTALSSAGPLTLVIDNGWAAAPDWEQRTETAATLIDAAERADLPVSITFTAETAHDATPESALAAREKLAAARPRPLEPDRARAIESISAALAGARPGTLVFLADGIENDADEPVVQRLSALEPGELRIVEGDNARTVALTAVNNGATTMTARAVRLDAAAPLAATVSALDAQGRAIASGPLNFGPGQSETTAEIAVPFELRNDFARLQIDGIQTAGAVRLLDDGFKRRRVALISGESGSDFQPLLQPLYYIERALGPYADLVKPDNPDLAAAIPALLEQNPSAIVMADVGRLPAGVYEPMQRWLANGGTLIRFAGPRLAAAPADDPLVPVLLRQGERAFGGALSWSEPQPLAPFPAAGPFAGLPNPDDVTVTRQVLAEPVPDLAQKTLASLADGTPLVTMKDEGSGHVILFHVSAEATWSNLPLSGHFVEMLRRLVQLSRSGGVSAESQAAAAATLPPWRLLTASGSLTAETGNARPLTLAPSAAPLASFDTPPGLYGSEDGFTALNLLAADASLAPIDPSAGQMTATRLALAGDTARPLAPWLYLAAFLMLLADSLIMLFMNGAFRRLPKARTAAAMIAALAFLAPLTPDRARADDSRPGDEVILDHLQTTRLAYVITGEADVDRISEQGLAGLTDFLLWRTALEPGKPVGLDITRDELSFYPLIYWPVSASAQMPSPEAISRIDAYMRAGGTVLFDTRDQIGGIDGGQTSPNTERLQAILGNIDIPPLEPVPEDHVLARSFYLLHDFPGRYTGSPLWVEARPDGRNGGSTSLSSSGDGVSPILITGNDFAGAWAVDNAGNPVLPTVPADEVQREHAFRTGVNIMMYMLTGNYKADQVHIPALLERLGQ